MAKDISELPRDLDTLFKSLFGKEELQEIAQWIRDTIYKRTKAGKGLTKQTRSIGGAANEKLKKLSDSYKLVRSGKLAFFTIGSGAGRVVIPYEPKTKPKLGPFASPNKSNLTFTGELLESIEASVKNGEVRVEIPNKTHGSGISLQKLLDFVEEARPFFGLSDTEMKTLDSMIRRMIRDKLRAANKK